ncbi:MAG: hypothetical protein EBT07_15625 [Actinobacteria bacterium]|nr:hypothetical protein [Actinomycetota bacterium]
MSVFRAIDLKFEGACIFLDICRIHPSGVCDFLGRVFGVKRKFNSHLVAPVKIFAGGGYDIAEIEAIRDKSRKASVEFNLQIASISGEDFTVGWYVW